MRSPCVVVHFHRLVLAALVLLALPALALAAGNGRLQIHHIDCGQGDAALLISPLGEMALFDDGTSGNCGVVKTYLQGLGISSVKYHFTTHYHSDHIGCMDDLAAVGITVSTAGYDRGGSYTTNDYTYYVNTLGSRRATLSKGQTITMDAGAANPVIIKVVDLNGAGVYSGTDENALSTVYKISYGAFDEVIGGDLSQAVEPTVGPEVGNVEVFKVHHHGSATSNTDSWLTATAPKIGVISVGNGNSYNHPTSAALTRLHSHGVKTYWTETGNGVAPNASWDKVGGTIRIEGRPASTDSFYVYGTGFTDRYVNGGGAPPVTVTDSLVPSSTTILLGSVGSGSYASLAADDAVYYKLGATMSGGLYGTDWYGTVTLAHPPTSLSVKYNGKFSQSRTQTLYLYNWSSGAWTQVDQATVSTTDVTRIYTPASPANYVSSTRQVRLRVAGNMTSGSYTTYGDYMRFTYQYLQGTAPALIARGASTASWTPADPAPAPAVLDFASTPNPARDAARIRFTLAQAARVRVEIFDLSGRRVAVPYDAEAPAGFTSVNWDLRSTGGARVASGLYFARLQGAGAPQVTRIVALGH